MNYGLVLKKVHKVIKFNQKTWSKTYIDMNTELRKEANNVFKKEFFKLMNNVVFWKAMVNMRKHRDIKLVTTEAKGNYLVSESNHHTSKFFSENLLAIEIRKTQILMNKPVYIGRSILELSKIAVHEFWYNYVKPK